LETGVWRIFVACRSDQFFRRKFAAIRFKFPRGDGSASGDSGQDCDNGHASGDSAQASRGNAPKIAMIMGLATRPGFNSRQFVSSFHAITSTLQAIAARIAINATLQAIVP
jgi:hypothetical protein